MAVSRRTGRPKQPAAAAAMVSTRESCGPRVQRVRPYWPEALLAPELRVWIIDPDTSCHERRKEELPWTSRMPERAIASALSPARRFRRGLAAVSWRRPRHFHR